MLSPERKQHIMGTAFLPQFPNYVQTFGGLPKTRITKQLRYGAKPEYIHKNLENAVKRYEDEIIDR